MIPLIKTLLPAKEILLPRLEEVLYSGYIAQGDVVDEFESAFSKYIGAKNCLSVNSGTSALHIALILNQETRLFLQQLLQSQPIQL